MKSLLRRIITLEQHVEAVPIDLPPLPPPGASEAELMRASEEAWAQFQAAPNHPAWHLRLIQLAQRNGIRSKVGAESFRSPPDETSGPVD
jgi:hypothetical protein